MQRERRDAAPPLPVQDLVCIGKPFAFDAGDEAGELDQCDGCRYEQDPDGLEACLERERFGGFPGRVLAVVQSYLESGTLLVVEVDEYLEGPVGGVFQPVTDSL